jgi:hypothetical protein
MFTVVAVQESSRVLTRHTLGLQHAPQITRNRLDQVPHVRRGADHTLCACVCAYARMCVWWGGGCVTVNSVRAGRNVRTDVNKEAGSCNRGLPTTTTTASTTRFRLLIGSPTLCARKCVKVALRNENRAEEEN